MLEKKSLKAQFIINFVMIIIVSLLATVLVYGLGYRIYRKIEYRRIYPANHYEREIPRIEEYVRKADSSLLNKEEKQPLEKIIPAEGILYQVMDADGRKVYGTDHRDLIKGKRELSGKINTTMKIDGGYAKLIPLLDSQDKIQGAVSLYYTIKPYFPNNTDKIWLSLLFIVIMLAPFIFIIIFALFFARRFAHNIGKPVYMLITAAERVRDRDLNFDLDYQADNELGRLCSAFNKMKNELRESLFSKWRSEQEKREMVEALAHDLKTPFSVIQGYAESLLDGGHRDQAKTKRYLQVIKENAGKGSDLVTEMLYTAELESRAKGLCLLPTDLEAFLLEKRENYEIMTDAKSISFILNISGARREQRRVVYIDRARLERILDNIVLNAIRFTPEDGIITIDVRIEEQGVSFSICDTGKGFTDKDLANVFSKFYQGDEARSSKNGHSGLGLYVAKKLVEIHEGIIKAFNAKDAGACITFELPYLRKDDK